MSKNMSECPECGTAFEAVAEQRDLPLQAIAQACPSCNYTVDIGIINFPDRTYDVVAPAIEGDTCTALVTDDSLVRSECGDDAEVRHQRSRLTDCTECLCAEHNQVMYEQALDLADDL